MSAANHPGHSVVDQAPDGRIVDGPRFNLEKLHLPVPGWLYLGVAACSVVGILYLWGQAIAAPAAVVLGVLIAWQLAPHVGTAWLQLEDSSAVPPEHDHSAHYTVGGFVAAALSALVALPWAARWLRLPLG